MKTKNLSDWGKYILFVILLILVSYFYINAFEKIDINDLRYLLSALAQSQAAIIGILVTLTFVTIQLFSQKFSMRSMDLILKDKGLIMPILIYSFSILYDLILLGIISTIDNRLLIFVLTLMSIWLVILSFLALAYFIRRLSLNLNTNYILKKLLRKIRKNANLYAKDISSQRKLYDFELKNIDMKDYITPIKDIVKNSLRNDQITAKEAINSIVKAFSILIEESEKYSKFVPDSQLSKYDNDKKKYILQLILQRYTLHILDLLKDALDNKDESTTSSIIKAIGDVYFLNAKTIEAYHTFVYDVFFEIIHNNIILNEFKIAINQNVNTLISGGRKAMKLQVISGLFSLIEALEKIFESTSKDENFREMHINIDKFLSEVCVYSSENGAIAEMIKSVEINQKIEEEFFGRGYHMDAYARETIKATITASKNIIDKSPIKYLRELLETTIQFYGLYTAQKEIDPPIKMLVEKLEIIAYYAIDKKYYEALEIITGVMGKIGSEICKHGGTSIDYLIDSFENILKHARKVKSFKLRHANYSITPNLERFITELIDFYIKESQKKEEKNLSLDFVPDRLRYLLSHKTFGKWAKQSFRAYKINPFFLSVFKQEEELFKKLKSEIKKLDPTLKYI